MDILASKVRSVFKELLLDAVLGTEPPPVLFKSIEDQHLGQFTGGHIDRWSWNRYALGLLTFDELDTLYTSIKHYAHSKENPLDKVPSEV
jgi:hypothetical protein